MEWFSEVRVRILATYCSCYLWTNRFQWSRIDSGSKSALELMSWQFPIMVLIGNNFFTFYYQPYHKQLNITTSLIKIDAIFIDTAFMYMIGILGCLRLYQSRHHDLIVNAHFAYAGLALIIFVAVLGVVSNTVNYIFQ